MPLGTRIYVQGLTENSDSDIALLFDRHSEPGGDHFRCRFKEPVKEVLTVRGSEKFIKERDWNAHVERQRVLLREQGFTDDKIAEYY